MGEVQISEYRNIVTMGAQNSISIEKIDIYTEDWWLQPGQPDREHKEV